MDKIRDINKYIDTVKNNSNFFESYYFHSLLDLNLIKLESILQNGILSKNLIEQKDLPSLYTHDCRDFDSKNGSTYISLTEYLPNSQFSLMFESFALHTLTSLSLMINKSIDVKKQGERETFFDDELFCLNSIDPSYLEGIILPEHLSTLSINQVNFLANDYNCYTRTYLKHWIDCVEQYFNTTLPQAFIENIKESRKQLKTILDNYERPEGWIQLAIRIQRDQYGQDLNDVLANIMQYLWSLKFDLPNPTYMDIVMKLNNNQLPIYEIKQKCLKRII